MQSEHDPSASGLRVSVANDTFVARYELRSELGRGGGGTVYEAFDPELNRVVALKVMTTQTPQVAAKATREARTMARLAHPNVVQVFDVGQHQRLVYIVMELASEGNAWQWFQRHRPPSEDVIRLFIQAGEGLHAAHRNGLVHRDFKPSNILVARDGQARVADFGLASLDVVTTDIDANDLRRGLTNASTVDGGTPGFVAPEVCAGRSSDARSDQYAYCVSLVQVLTGTLPHSKDEAAALLANTSLTRSTKAALLRGLSDDPARRFSSVKELLEQLTVPTPRSPTLVAGVGFVGVLALIGWGVSAGSGRTCAVEATTPLDDADVGRLRDQFRSPSESDLADRAIDAIDAYATRMAATRTALCSTRHNHQRMFVDAAQRCLRDAEIQFETLAEQLGQRHAQTLGKTVSAFSSALPAPEGCLNPAHYELDEPSSAAQRLVEQEIARSKALSAAGQGARALESARRALDLAKALGPATRARAHRHVGSQLSLSNQAEQAIKHHDRSFFLARSVGANDLALSAALSLTNLHAKLRDVPTAASWLRHAGALLERHGTSLKLRFDFWLSVATMHQARGELDDALTATDMVLWLDVDDARKNRLAQTRGNLLNALGEFSAAERELRSALDWQHQNLGSSHLYRIQSRTLLGITLSSLGRHDEAAVELGTALERAQQWFPSDKKRLVSLYQVLGAARLQSRDTETALRHLERALELQESDASTKGTSLGISLLNLSRAADQAKDYARAQTYGRRASAEFELALGREHPMFGLGLTAWGVAQHHAGQHRAAIVQLDQADTLWTRTSAHKVDHPKLLLVLVLAMIAADVPAPEVEMTAARAYARLDASPVPLPSTRKDLDVALAQWRGQSREATGPAQ